MDTITEDIV